MRWLLICLTCFYLPANAATDSNLNATLGHIAKATAQLSYDGTFMYQHDGRVDISHIAHRIDSAGELAKLDILSGPPHAFVRINDAVYCYIPNGDQVKVERRQHHQFFPELLPANTSSISENYTIKSLGTSTIASRNSIGLSLIPNDGYRYAYQLWADAESGLLLKFVKLDSKLRNAGEFTFSQVDIGQAPERSQFQAGYINKKTIVLPSKEIETKSNWRIRKLPSGYFLIRENIRELPGKQHNVIHQIYSDGLSIVSIFIEPLEQLGNNPPTGLTSQGLMSLYAHHIGQYQITALGEVPAATLLFMVDNLSQVTAP
ncbi:MAG: MucB/RseB C-terminal domain-containing protein [Sulfuriferula sp.]